MQGARQALLHRQNWQKNCSGNVKSDVISCFGCKKHFHSLVKDGLTMTITPFLALSLRGKKDTLSARQKARRAASLLGYDLQEQACIAAGTFVIACQALTLFGKARLCFQIENNHLEVFAQELKSKCQNAATSPSANRITGLFRTADPKSLYRLSKPLPPEQSPHFEEMDLGWLVNKIEETACTGLFDEIVKQNQEMLTLLHELRLCQANLNEKEEKLHDPHAA